MWEVFREFPFCRRRRRRTGIRRMSSRGNSSEKSPKLKSPSPSPESIQIGNRKRRENRKYISLRIRPYSEMAATELWIER